MSRRRFLDLTKIHLPVTAFVSIAHRISGMIMFFLLPMASYLFIISLKSPDKFLQVSHLFHSTYINFILYFCLILIFFHGFAGVRHLFMDVGYFENLRSGRVSAWVILFLTLVLIVIGFMLWI